LRVYVVWVKRWAFDTREEIDGAGMVDPRVIHLWDGANLVDRNATWGDSTPRPVSSGATVIGDSDRLAASAASLLR
jgi:hypothetical protein